MILSCKQIEQYLENGYLLVLGLIPSDIVKCAEAIRHITNICGASGVTFIKWTSANRLN